MGTVAKKKSLLRLNLNLKFKSSIFFLYYNNLKKIFWCSSYNRRRRNCRLWWPSNLFSQTPPNSSFLFGWFLPSSFDVVVAFASDELNLTSSLNSGSDLLEILQGTNKYMPAFLQEKCKISLLGYFEADFNENRELIKCGNDRTSYVNSTSDQELGTHTNDNNRSWSCGCPKHDRIVEQSRLASLRNIWIKLVYSLSDTTDGRVLVIPKLDHLHLNNESIALLDLHVIFYEKPTFGGHHYSLGDNCLSNLAKSPCKKPKWFNDLHQRDTNLNLDTVIQAINSADAAQVLFDGCRHAEPGVLLPIVQMLSTFAWKLSAACLASLSTVIYIVLQTSCILYNWLSCTSIDILFIKAFSNTLKNIHFRCCQLLYWPVFLQDQGIRYWSCVEFAEKATFLRHTLWSSIVVDILLGNIVGITLWFVAEPARIWVSNFANDFTNDWLRIGCVWLMGNPAGFKLNTELAGVLGMVSLNAIQIWSTLWAFMGFLLVHITKGLALCGIMFGLTSAAALITDMISLVTMHVLALHLFLSLLYSTQIQALAALWRLFRGRKQNPLRHRLDSYDYTIEQHVVGSLLFTPILLLLPTTSVFYIFFTIMHTTISFICIVVEVSISFIHSTPYAKVFLWLRRKERFPSGIWFKVALYQHSENGDITGITSLSPRNLHTTAYPSSTSQSITLVSFLHSNYLNLGEVVQQHYRHLYSAFSRSSIGTSAYGFLTGRSTLYASGPSLPMKLPWIVISWREYWRLCHDSILACRKHKY